MENSKFTITEVKERGIMVKFDPKNTTTNEIEAFMIKELAGTNDWKCFGDILWFYRNPNLEDEDEEDEEDSDYEDSDDE